MATESTEPTQPTDEAASGARSRYAVEAKVYVSAPDLTSAEALVAATLYQSFGYSARIQKITRVA